ncbi:MAG TPA: TetR/AcrR family transcriptional regulator [Solirubrobacterales bacterium]|nr:TetR/AcrR family transcriptional regulator [Solirubrobacterales bacterium]
MPRQGASAPIPAVGQDGAPRSRRGLRTRATLIGAARTVFERDGYLDARITDIAKEAGVAAGSFYTYFDGKEEIFAALVETVQEDMLHPHVRERPEGDGAAAQIDAANREYLRAYKRNVRLMALFEQVAQIDEEFEVLRRKRGHAFITRNTNLIRRLQEEGKADTDIDPRVTALALSTMVSRMAYLVFVLGERIPFERLLENLNMIWVNALRLEEP